MLVFTRCIGESFRIGDDVILTVTETNRRQVRLGIDAPKEVSVMRKELMAPGSKKKRNRAAEPSDEQTR